METKWYEKLFLIMFIAFLLCSIIIFTIVQWSKTNSILPSSYQEQEKISQARAKKEREYLETLKVPCLQYLLEKYPGADFKAGEITGKGSIQKQNFRGTQMSVWDKKNNIDADVWMNIQFSKPEEKKYGDNYLEKIFISLGFKDDARSIYNYQKDKKQVGIAKSIQKSNTSIKAENDERFMEAMQAYFKEVYDMQEKLYEILRVNMIKIVYYDGYFSKAYLRGTGEDTLFETMTATITIQQKGGHLKKENYLNHIKYFD